MTYRPRRGDLLLELDGLGGVSLCLDRQQDWHNLYEGEGSERERIVDHFLKYGVVYPHHVENIEMEEQ